MSIAPKKGMTGKKPMGIRPVMAEPAGPMPSSTPMMKKGGKVKKYARGGSIDGVAQRGKTKAC